MDRCTLELPTRLRGRKDKTMKPRARYQNGSITREARMHDSDVWVLRWREMNPDGSWIRRKSVIGTVKEHPSKAAAFKASGFLRSTINRETRPPRTIAELIHHYGKNELPNKTQYTQEGLHRVHQPVDHPEMGNVPALGYQDSGGGILAWYLETGQRNTGKDTQHHVGAVFTRDAMGVL